MSHFWVHLNWPSHMQLLIWMYIPRILSRCILYHYWDIHKVQPCWETIAITMIDFYVCPTYSKTGCISRAGYFYHQCWELVGHNHSNWDNSIENLDGWTVCVYVIALRLLILPRYNLLYKQLQDLVKVGVCGLCPPLDVSCNSCWEACTIMELAIATCIIKSIYSWYYHHNGHHQSIVMYREGINDHLLTVVGVASGP